MSLYKTGSVYSLPPAFTLTLYLMEYSLPGPVVALLKEENASLSPKAYFISSSKKSIKITLVYAKGAQDAADQCSPSVIQRKKSRHGTKNGGNSTKSRQASRNVSESSDAAHTEQGSAGSSSAHSDAENACIGLELNTSEHPREERERMSTVDSGHPSSSEAATNERLEEGVGTASESEEGEEEEEGPGAGDSECSTDSEKPRTPGRDIAVVEPALRPSDTPAARRDEMWQTWTRIPRSSNTGVNRSHYKYMSAPSTSTRRSLSPAVGDGQRRATSSSQRRPRLHEGVSWDGSGNL